MNVQVGADPLRAGETITTAVGDEEQRDEKRDRGQPGQSGNSEYRPRAERLHGGSMTNTSEVRQVRHVDGGGALHPAPACMSSLRVGRRLEQPGR